MLPCPLHQRGLTLTEHTWPPVCANATRDVRTAVQTDVRRTVPTDPTGFHNLMWATLPVCGVWLGWGLCWPALSRDTELAERDRDVGIRRTDLLQEGLTWLWTPGSPTDHICRRRSQPESDGLGAMGGGGGAGQGGCCPFLCVSVLYRPPAGGRPGRLPPHRPPIPALVSHRHCTAGPETRSHQQAWSQAR